MKLQMLIAVSYLVAAVAAPAFGEADTLLQAIGFALTGSDNAKVRPVDRSNCVFRLEGELIQAQPDGSGEFAVFHLNHIQEDRLAIQNWIRKSRFGETKYVTVELHGNATVYETTLPPMQTEQPSDTEFVRQLFKAHPQLLKQRHVSTNEQTLQLAKSDSDRVNRAWQF
jgi:hypothetical protein